MPKILLNVFATVCFCALGTVVIAFAWHVLAPNPPVTNGSTEYICRFLYAGVPRRWQSALAFVLWAAAAGHFTRTGMHWIVAGFVLPYAVALFYEIKTTPTSHNLFPFEIVLFWGPLAIAAVVGGALGRFLVRRLRPQFNTA